MNDAVKPAVSDEMVNAAWNAGKHRRMTGLPPDFRAVVEAALAAQGQEPVAWRYQDKAGGWILDHSERSAREYQRKSGIPALPLFAASPTISDVVTSLSDEQLRHIADAKDVTACRSRIRSALTAPAQPVGVPVRWLVENTLQSGSVCWSTHEHENDARKSAETTGGKVTPLYAAPQPPAEDGWTKLQSLTFAVQHNPNCPSPWLIRLPGESGSIDMKPYGDGIGFVTHQTGDILGFGKTLEQAATAALSALPPAPANGGEQNG